MIFSLATHGFYDLENTELKNIIYDLDKHKDDFIKNYPQKFVKIVFTLIGSKYSAEELEKIRQEIDTFPCKNFI